jgi:glycosyltransferase involved in cell wall biosynthesis
MHFNTSRPRKNQILLCSRLLPRKGFQYVIEAVRDLSLDWQVHIVGDGPYMETLKKLAGGSKTTIVFHGWLDRSDLKFKDLFETSSIFILPSEMENFPTVLLEAMSAGLSIITSAAGGCPEVIGNAGLIIEPANTNALRSAILSLTGDIELRDRLANLGKKQVELFSWETVARQYQKLYQSILQ